MDFFDSLVNIVINLVQKWPYGGMILMLLGSGVVIGQAIVIASPSTKDDEAWAKIQAIPFLGELFKKLATLGIVQKK